MQIETIEIPTNAVISEHVIASLDRYWPQNRDLIDSLPIARTLTSVEIELPLKLCEVALPHWAKCWGVNGVLLIPEELLPLNKARSDKDLWLEVDWLLAMFLMLEAWHERVWEAQHGPIHSYSFRLKKWDNRFWERAWVNRMALFLREWAGNKNSCSPDTLFGELPNSDVILTHDVDAISKTLAISLKQSAFTGFNIFRNLAAGNVPEVGKGVKKAFRMLFSREDWWTFKDLLQMEADRNIKSIFYFHANPHPKTFKRWLFDPGYSINDKKIKKLFAELKKIGNEIGLHPSFDSWNDEKSILDQKNTLEISSNIVVSGCRQHWLRFSWEKTWAAQEHSDLVLDTTLMFNDQPGFRNASALSWSPWNTTDQKVHILQALSTVCMDSHFYDYQQLSVKQRTEQISRWLSECHVVHGTTAVLWHPHTLTQDYGWREGFISLLNIIQDLRKSFL